MYIRRQGDPVKAVRWTGDNITAVREVYPGIGEEYMRDKGCRIGDWVISPNEGRVYFMNDIYFQEVYEPLEIEETRRRFDRGDELITLDEAWKLNR